MQRNGVRKQFKWNSAPTNVLWLTLAFMMCCLLLVSCGGGGGDNGANSDVNAIIPSTTKVLDQSSVQKMALVSSDQSILTFSATTTQISNLTVGDVIVIGVTNLTPDGLIRKIDSIDRSGNQVRIVTSQASLEDAIERGSFSLSRTLTQQQLASIVALQSGISLQDEMARAGADETGFYLTVDNVVIYDDDGNTSTENDQITAKGTIRINPTFTLNFDIIDHKAANLVFRVTLAETIEVQLESKVELTGIHKKYQIPGARMRFTPITVWIGYVPVVITPILDVCLGFDGEVSVGINTKVSQQATASVGIERGGPYKDFSNTFSFDPPTLSAGAEAKAYMGPQLSFLIYGIAGPYAEVRGYLELSADLLSNPWWELYGGIEADVGFRAKMLGKTFEYEYPMTIGAKRLLAQASAPPDQYGTLSGSVKDAVSQAALSNVQVTLYKLGMPTAYTGFSNSSGTYSIPVAVGTGYRVGFTKTGYLTTYYEDISISANQTKFLEAVLQINQIYSGNGNISGKVVNALTGAGVQGLTVNLRSGINAQSGQIVSTTNTLSGGTYSINSIAAGNYTAQVSGSGYNTAHFSVLCIGGSTLANQNGTITPTLSNSEIRIILTWGASPADLDSHLTGPLSNGTRFHLYFPLAETNSGSTWPSFVKLDLDNRSGFGPETTTIYQQTPGIYRFSVHDFTNRNSTSSYSLSNSNAQVRIYKGSNLIGSFNVPANRGGTLWTVFEYNSSTGQITDKNIMSYLSDPTIVSAEYISETDANLLSNLPDKN